MVLKYFCYYLRFFKRFNSCVRAIRTRSIYILHVRTYLVELSKANLRQQGESAETSKGKKFMRGLLVINTLSNKMGVIWNIFIQKNI